MVGTALFEELKKAGIEYTVTDLNFGSFGAAPACLVHYTRKSEIRTTVLLVPFTGPDSWLEQYFIFDNLSQDEIEQRDWYEIYEFLRSRR